MADCSAPISGLARMRKTTATMLSLVLLAITPEVVFAHGGHSDAEFQGGEQVAPTADSIQVDNATAQRIGLQVEPVAQRPLTVRIKATGQIEILPNQRVEVTTPIGGTITRLLVTLGERVTIGQVVAMMSSPEIVGLRNESLDRQTEAIAAVQQAQVDLKLAQETYQQQNRIVAQDITQAQVALSFAQEKYDKDKELLARGAIPRRTFLESETQLAAAKASLSRVESRLPVVESKAQIQRSQAALQAAQLRVQLSGKTYQTRLKQLGANPNANGTILLKAPISGIVSDREVTLGQSGQDAGLKVMTIVNGRRVQVSANIYEKDLNQIKVGQQVQVKVNGLAERTFQGHISVIGAVVEGETRVVPVRAELDNVDEVLKPGMFAELEVLTNQTTASVLAVPTTAVVETNDKKQIVFVQNGNAYEPVEVTLGQTAGELVAVKSGVFDGDMIVTQRANQLYAQSLRGGGSKESAEAEKPSLVKPEASSTTGTLLNLVNKPLPWWMMVPVGGAIAAGTFWISRRSARSKTSEADELDYPALPDSDSVHAAPADHNGFRADAHPVEPHDLDAESQAPSRQSR